MRLGLTIETSTIGMYSLRLSPSLNLSREDPKEGAGTWSAGERGSIPRRETREQRPEFETQQAPFEQSKSLSHRCKGRSL